MAYLHNDLIYVPTLAASMAASFLAALSLSSFFHCSSLAYFFKRSSSLKIIPHYCHNMAGGPLIGKLVIIFFWGKQQNPEQNFMGKLNHKLYMYHSDVEMFAVTLLHNYLI